MVVIRNQILDICKLDALNSRDTVVQKWFGEELGIEERANLKVCGVLQDVDGNDYILPLMLQGWASNLITRRTHPMWTLAHHLQEAYDADTVLEATHEKQMEDVIVHYEAVRRICRAGRAGGETIGSFFKTGFIGEKWKKISITIKVPTADDDGIIAQVANFTDVGAVVKLLQEGFIVVSKNRTEKGLEYAAPFFDLRTNELIVECAQCKLVAGGVKWGEAALKFDNDFTAALTTKKIEWFPVMYTNHHTETGTLQAATYADGVYFNEITLFWFTQPLGILRMHLEKIGDNLSALCPSLLPKQLV
jgi:hypothetical protein